MASVAKIDRLLSVYQQHLTVPWQPGIAAVQRVIFAVYDKTDELRLRAKIDEFRLATEQAGKVWLPIDLTNAFPEWMVAHKYRESYFKAPRLMTGYPTGEITGFITALVDRLKAQIAAEAGPDTVVALYGVGSLFGLARVSTIVGKVQEAVTGRLLVFFPGEFHPEDNTYSLLDARDGWNYLAIPLLATE